MKSERDPGQSPGGARPQPRRVLMVGCGYVGAALGAQLARSGHRVFGIRRHPDTDGSLRAVGIEPLRADIASAADLRSLPAGFDWVINTAASSAGSGEEDYRRVYLEGTANLLDWLRPAPPSRYVTTSSTSVYGQDDGSWVDESSATEPAASTAKVLVDTERLLLDANRHHAFPSIILRVAGIYGPGRGYWLRQFLQGSARIPNAGKRWVNMVHRADVVGAVEAVLQIGQAGQIYNLVDDEPVTHLELFRWLAERCHKPLPPFEEDTAGTSKRGATNKRVSNRKLRKETGYAFRFPTFREGFNAELQDH